MFSSTIENLTPEILLQICELLRDTHPASIRNLSETSHKVRNVAKTVVFQNVILPIRGHDSVKEDVQKLYDALEPVSVLGHIRTLRLCRAWKDPSKDQKSDRGTLYLAGGDGEPAEVVWTYDHAWQPIVKLLRRCSSLQDLLCELKHQLPPCVLDALHQFRPRCRLHMRTFSARSLMESEPDKHELALASSPCLYSIWFSHMESEEDEPYANRSRRVVQQVLARLAPNVEEVRFRRSALVRNGSLGWREIKLPMEKDSLYQPTRLRRLEITTQGFQFVLTRQESKSWHTHVDFSHLHALILKSPLDPDDLQCLIGCDFASLRILNFQLKSGTHLRSSQTILELARSFVTSMPPLSELTIGDRWSVHVLKAVYQRHGASLHTLRLPNPGRGGIDKAALILEMKDQCPRLTDLEVTIRRDQGSRAEMAIYKAFASFPSLRRLELGLRIRLYELERQQTDYDDFDRRTTQGSLYGEIRKTFMDQAVDENFAMTVFHLISPQRRSYGLEELELTSRNEAPYYGPQSPVGDVLNHICRSL
jgi:hypothetical protein